MSRDTKDPYKIVINWDEGAMYNFLPVQAASEREDVDARAIKAMLEDIIDEHAKAHVDVLVHGVFSGFVSMMPYPRSFEPADGHHEPATADEHEQWCLKHNKFWLRGIKKLSDAGLDLVEIVRARCKMHHMPFYVGFRMNDRHAGSGTQTSFYPRVEQMGRDHPEWTLKEYPGGVDYKYEGVRNAVLEFVAEAIARYDLDGMELDWMRWCHMFQSSEAAENAPLLTDFIRKVRNLLDEAAAQRGRDRLPLGVRIASTMDECTNLGYDVAAWIGEGLLDHICPSDFYFTDDNCPVEDFVALTKGTECKVYPSIHPGVSWGNQQGLMNIETYRAAARNFYAYGAHGVSPYNYMYHWGKIRSDSYPGPVAMWPNAMSFLTELRDGDLIAKGNRHYLFHSPWEGHRDGHCPTGALKNEQIILDRSTDDPHGTFVFRIAEHLEDPKLSATLEFKVTDMIEADELEVRINGDIIPDRSIRTRWRIGQSPKEGRPMGPHLIYRMPLSYPPAVFGDNELGVRLRNRVGMSRRRLKVQEIEIRVKVES